jgi:hypothetical protein
MAGRAMSYQFCLLRFDHGEVVPVESDLLRSLLAKHGILHLGYVETGDSLSIELGADRLFSEPSVMDILITTRGISPGLVALMYDLAQEAKLVLVVTDNPTIAVVTDEQMLKQLPDSDSWTTVVCRSAEELASVVVPKVIAWQKWAFGDPPRVFRVE